MQPGQFGACVCGRVWLLAVQGFGVPLSLTSVFNRPARPQAIGWAGVWSAGA
jgi:hypothetical protein